MGSDSPLIQHITTHSVCPQDPSNGLSVSGHIPSALQLASDPIHLSNILQQQLQLALTHVLAKSTRAGYGHAVNHFIAFCVKEKVPPVLRWPANEFVLCTFAAFHVGSTSGNTVRSYMAAPQVWHNTHNAPWHGSACLSYVLCSMEKLTPLSSKHPPHPPITRSMFQVLHSHLDLNSPFDSAIFSAACCAFWGQCRLGELLCTSLCDYTPSRYPTTQSLTYTPSSASIFLPWTKTTKAHGATIIFASQIPPFNPICAVQHHIVINKTSIDSHLFAYHFRGTLRPLTRSAFLSECNQIWTTHGYPRSTGHSFHIGGTTELLLAGVHLDVVKAMGH
ncbi:hypothetical protein K439DRAFT_1372417 [Ramaria rubella]|nr:hypothetical protein K439DRAFT_1372417 [Ramaria rubella]